MKVLVNLTIGLLLSQCWFKSSSGSPTTPTTINSRDDEVNCPDDWFNAKELGCFKFLETRVNLNWVEAQIECGQIGGYLAEPRTTRQAEFLGEIAILEAPLTGIQFWYIGLTDLSREGDWLWIHAGLDLEESYWGENKPTGKSNNNCGVMSVKKNQLSWEDHDCLESRVGDNPVAPVCQTDKVAAPTTTAVPATTTTPVQCPSNQWSEFQGHCYRSYYSYTYSWTYSDADCLGLGGRLVSVHSAAEEEFLQGLTYQDYWMGGYPSGNTWVWSDGTDYDYVGPVDQMEAGECIYYKYGHGWSTKSCTSSGSYYVCKI